MKEAQKKAELEKQQKEQKAKEEREKMERERALLDQTNKQEIRRISNVMENKQDFEAFQKYINDSFKIHDDLRKTIQAKTDKKQQEWENEKNVYKKPYLEADYNRYKAQLEKYTEVLNKYKNSMNSLQNKGGLDLNEA